MENDESAFAEAQQAEALRKEITQHARGAVKFGNVDRDWVNTRLARLGAEIVTGDAQYKINVRVLGDYGTTITAGSRTEAVEKFKQIVSNLAAAGQIRTARCGEGIYNVSFDDVAEPVFFSGPQDFVADADNPVPGLDALKDGIRQMIKQGVTEQGWGYSYAIAQLASMGLPTLPPMEYRTVNVPVTGTAEIVVSVFEDADDVVVQNAAEGVMTRAKSVVIKPEEIGNAYVPRPDGMSMNLVDDAE